MPKSDLVKPDRMGYTRAQEPSTGTPLNDERKSIVFRLLIEAGGQIEGYSIETISNALGLSGSAASVVLRRMDAAGMIGRLREGSVSIMWLRGPGLEEAVRLGLAPDEPDTAASEPADPEAGADAPAEAGSNLVGELARRIAPAVKELTDSLGAQIEALEAKLRATERERDDATAEVDRLRPYETAYDQIMAVKVPAVPAATVPDDTATD